MKACGARAHLQDLDLKPDLVSRGDRTPELGAVDPREVHELRLPVRHSAQQEDGPHLGHRLDDQDARHDRVAGEVALEERLVEGDVLDADHALPLLDLQDPIDQEERVAVREDLQDPPDVHHGRRLPHRSSSTPAQPERRLARRLVRAATLRAAPPAEAASAPAASSRSSRATRCSSSGSAADFAPTTAPSPSVRCPAAPDCPARITARPNRVLPAIPDWATRTDPSPTTTL